jgi:hypothetical protein
MRSSCDEIIPVLLIGRRETEEAGEAADGKKLAFLAGYQSVSTLQYIATVIVAAM